MEEKLHMKSKCSSRFYLSNDVVHKVLLLLPAKSVGRFRCVSKTWLSISSSPLFLRAHARNSPLTFLLQNVPTKLKPQFNFQQIFPETADGSSCRTTIRFSGEALASCDGLLLLETICSSPNNPQNDYSRYEYYVLNPVTGDRVRLRNLPVTFDRWYVGFYFHRWSGEYRLLNLYDNMGTRYSLKAEILSLGTAKHSWRPIEAEAPVFIVFPRNFPVLVNDCLYWICLKAHQHSKLVILAFDIREETLRLITLPPTNHVFPQRSLLFGKGLVDVNGRLGCWMIRRDCPSEDDLTMELFVADNGVRRWEEMYSVCCSGERRHWLQHNGFLKCVFSIKEGKLLFLFMGNVMYMVEWDLKSRKYYALEVYDDSRQCFTAFMFTESLISPSSKVEGCSWK